MQSKDVILNILEPAITIASRLVFTDFSKPIPNEQDYRHDAVSLLGYMKAIEALVKHGTTLPLTLATSINDYEKDEVAKINRKLRLWATRPTQVNTIILTSFLKLKHEDSDGMVKLDMLKDRYQRECIAKYRDKFRANFDQMKTISDRNHAKVFDVDSMGYVTIWPNALEAVEDFRKLLNIGK